MKQGEGVAFPLVDVALLPCQGNQSIFQVFGTLQKNPKHIKKKKETETVYLTSSIFDVASPDLQNFTWSANT